jgi:hypothetical protein
MHVYGDSFSSIIIFSLDSCPWLKTFSESLTKASHAQSYFALILALYLYL